MRKLILMASIVVMASSAQAAEQNRGLVMASNQASDVTQDAPARMSVSKQLEQLGEIKPAEKPAEVQPKIEEQPKLDTQPKAEIAPEKAPTADVQVKTDVARPQIKPEVKPNVQKADSKPRAEPRATQRAEQPKRRHVTTEARVIYELHRHGIYW